MVKNFRNDLQAKNDLYICQFRFLFPLKTLIPSTPLRFLCRTTTWTFSASFGPLWLPAHRVLGIRQMPFWKILKESFLCINFTFCLCHKHTNIVHFFAPVLPSNSVAFPSKFGATNGEKRQDWGYRGSSHYYIYYPRSSFSSVSWGKMVKWYSAHVSPLGFQCFAGWTTSYFFGAEEHLGWTFQSSFLTPLHYSWRDLSPGLLPFFLFQLFWGSILLLGCVISEVMKNAELANILLFARFSACVCG